MIDTCKRRLIHRIIALIIIAVILSGCGLTHREVIQDDNSLSSEKEDLDSVEGSYAEGNELEEKDHTITSSVMLRSIEIIEDDSSLKLVITGLEDTLSQFMKDFTIEYYDDYNELRFSNLNTHLPPEVMLVHSGNISDITGSGFIKRWFKAPSNISHASVYSILFRFPVAYNVRELDNPGRIVVTVEAADYTPEEIYVLRSPSFKLNELWSHIEATVTFLNHIEADFTFSFRILKDETGYFYPIKTFRSKQEAVALRDRLIKMSEEQVDNVYNANFEGPYRLIIEGR